MFYRFLPLIVSILTIGFTTWATLAPLNGVDQAAISNKYLTLITPAGFTFSIWSLIYLSWIVVGVMIALKKIEVGKKQKIVFSSAIALTALWLFPWHYEKLLLSLIGMFCILVSLVYLLIKVQKKNTEKIWKWTVELSTGWIIVASLVNLGVYVVSTGVIVDTNTMVYLALFALALGTSVQLWIMYYYQSYIPVFVYIWALWGIYNGLSVFPVRITALGIAIFLLLNYIYLRKKAYQRVLIDKFGNEEKISKKKKK